MIRLDTILEQVRTYAPDADLAVVRKAWVFASKYHAGQRRKTGEPYFAHPLEVANILAGLRMDTDTIAVAILHDTVEDTQTTPEELHEHFGPVIRSIVEEVTDDKSLKKEERKRLQVEHAAHASDGAKQVKLADKICNLRDIAERPAADWSLERRQEYFDWAKKVADAVRGVHPALEAIFDATYARRPS